LTILIFGSNIHNLFPERRGTPVSISLDDEAPTGVTIIGAGIIGVCCAIALREAGLAVTLVDRGEPGNEASKGNAGCLAASEITPMTAPGLWRKVPRWLLDPLGPLALRPAHVKAALPWFLRFLANGREDVVARLTGGLASLSAVSWDLWPGLAERAGIADQITVKGGLTVYRTDAAFLADAGDRALKARHGVPHEVLGAAELAALEPDLAPGFRHAVRYPRWAHVTDPHRIVLKLLDHALDLGVNLEQGAEALSIGREGKVRVVTLSDGRILRSAHVVIAAGVWSKALCESLGSPVLMESERGYNTTLPNPGVTVNHPITLGEDKFVLSPLAVGLRIGGAAEFAGITAPANYKRSTALLTLARRALPGLREEGGTQWMGQRPSTPDGLPVIGRLPADPKGVVLAFGHGHLGLTNATGTAALVTALITGAEPPVNPAPFIVERFAR
jgi:D-amino-acid dehydrogenase